MKKYPYLEPQAKKAIDEAKGKDIQIFMMIDGYQTPLESIYLMDMLWYARDNGVTVLFVPYKIK